jgi:hypothetical protein
MLAVAGYLWKSMSNPVHLSGIAQLIKLRGGLEQIKLPGLAPILY